MSESNLKSLARIMVIPLRVVVFAGVLLFLLQAGEAHAIGGSFNPTSVMTLSDYDACAPADVTSEFGVPAGDMNFQVNVNYTPAAWGMADPDIPIGAVVGQLSSESTLGLFGGACNQGLRPTFTMYNATVDTSDELARAEAPDEPQDSAIDVDGNGILDGAEHYPEWLNDPDLLGGLQPMARSIGLNTTAAPGTNIILQFVIFAPGTCLPDAPCLPASAGYPAMTVLQDPTTVAPSAITDFCSPLGSTNITWGVSKDNPATVEDESGYVVRRNPIEGGSYTFTTYTRTYYNADEDDFENYLDSCPFDDNVDDPTVGAGDDLDSIDPACDPDPDTACWSGAPGDTTDCDDDGYLNAGDNCPQVPNGLDEDNQADADNDSIGDACDTTDVGNGPNVPDEGTLDDTLETVVQINEVADCDGDGMDNTYELANTCLDALVDDADEDADGDGVSNIDEMEAGTNPCAAEAVLDADGDGMPDSYEEDNECLDPEVDDADEDADGDGVSNIDEMEAETDPCVAEGVTPTASPTVVPGEGTPTIEEGTPAPGVTPTPTPAVEVEFCQPVIPGTYNGRVLVDGAPARSGYQVTASIDDIAWGSAVVSGGRYAMDIPDHMPPEPPCFAGGTIVFELNGMTCTPVEAGADEWAAGLQNVDLTCAAVVPEVTPTPTPPATPTPTPTPTVTPVKPPPTGAGGLAGSTAALPLWAMALAGWAGLMSIAGLGTLVAAKRR